ncbi:MAG: HesA/MoeB/ThiF family protein [Thermoproteota archaeon]|nr:HesA/MoeB/ThiF family protein [Thermoproteota archaeon]
MSRRVVELSSKELEQYSRQIVLTDIGYEGQLKLRNARVCIVGVGGLGSNIAIELAAMGVGFLRLIDRDVVEISNLHRQPIYDVDWLGYPKVEAAAARLKKLNPAVKTELLPISLNDGNVEGAIKGVDIVVDGLDRIEPRYALNRACIKLGIPYVFGAALEVFGNLTTIIPGKTPCLECFMSGLKDEELPTCGVAGVHPSIVSIISSLETSETVKIILGKDPSLAGRLLFVDLRTLSFSDLSINRIPECQVCGTGKTASRKKQATTRKLIEDICGRHGKPAYVITPRRDLKLNMKKLYKSLDTKDYDIKIRAITGATIDVNKETTISILRSGIAVIEGTKNPEEALNLYKKIIVDSLNVPWINVE